MAGVVLVLAAGVGLIQCIFIINTIEKVFPRLRNVPTVNTLIKLAQVFPVVVMVATAIWLFFLVFLPVKLERPYASREGALLVAVACYLWVNVAFNYLSAMLRSPGHPALRDEMDEAGLTCEPDAVLCLKCDRAKAYETHHCSTCGRCVRMMCHHCPFTNNCVGLENYSYFLSFICYSVVGLTFSMHMTYEPFYHCMVHNGEHLSTLPWHPPGVCKDLGDWAVIFIPVAFMWMFTTTMLLLQTTLLLSDWSTIDMLTEVQKSRSVSRFCRGLLQRILNRRKRRFRIMFLYSKERWWQFFVPSFNIPAEHMQTVKLMV